MHTTEVKSQQLFRAIQGKQPPMNRVKAGRIELERRLTRDFRAHVAYAKQQSRVDAALREPLIKALADDPAIAKIGSTMRRLKRARKPIVVKRPKVRPVQKWVGTGSLHLVIPPPYWPWQWQQTDGGSQASISVSGSSASMSLSADAAPYQAGGGHVWARAAVGTWFQPPQAGLLMISAAPSLNYDWWTDALFDNARSDGWLGLFVQEYLLSGTQGNIDTEQQVFLWQDSNWLGQDYNDGSNTGFSLSSGFISVSPDFFYEFWVWCGLDSNADGWNGQPWGSDATSFLNITVPSFTIDFLS